MTTTAITAAKGALKLVPLYIRHPAAIGQDTMLGAAAEACERLDRVPAAAAKSIEGLAQLIRLRLPQGRAGELCA